MKGYIGLILIYGNQESINTVFAAGKLPTRWKLNCSLINKHIQQNLVIGDRIACSTLTIHSARLAAGGRGPDAAVVSRFRGRSS